MTQSSDGLTERISSSIDTGTLLQPISKSQKSHLKDATDIKILIINKRFYSLTETFQQLMKVE